MNKRVLRLMLFAVAVVSFGVLYDNSERALAQTPTDVVASDCIYKQTASKSVVRYLRQHQRLPDCYITKREAYKRGWNPSAGNLCQVLPGKAIGGDRFSNREGRLPAAENRVWREADINYRCGRRGADRLLYSNDGLIFVTRDHYKNFIRME